MLSCLSDRRFTEELDLESSWEGSEAVSAEVIEEAGERREEAVEVVVLLLERPLKTDRRLGL